MAESTWVQAHSKWLIKKRPKHMVDRPWGTTWSIYPPVGSWDPDSYKDIKFTGHANGEAAFAEFRRLSAKLFGDVEVEVETGYKLIDAIWLSKRYNSSFKVPGKVAIDNLKPNDFVKIFFEDNMMPEFPERLWIQITTWDLNYGGTGRIANLPYCINVLYGDTIEFKAKHILDIMQREQYNARGGLQVPAVVPQKAKPMLALAAKMED